MQLSRLADECVKHLAAYRGYSANTIAQYDTTYRQFIAYLLGRGLTDDLRHFTDEAVMGFAEYLVGKVSSNSIRHRLTGLSALARYAMKARDARGRPRLASDPTKTFDWPQYQRPTTRYLYRDELRAFLAADTAPHEAIARALLVETGLRVSELIRARVGDLVEGPRGWALVGTVKGRGRREERVSTPLSAGLVTQLRGWLVDRGMPPATDALLVSSQGRAWTRPGFTEMIRRMAERAGISRLPVRPHVLRHTANVIARGANLDPFVRSRLLHHQSPASLQRYEHLVPDELHEARERASEGLRRYLGETPMPPIYAETPESGSATLRNDRETS